MRIFSTTCCVIGVVTASYAFSVKADEPSTSLRDALDAAIENPLSQQGTLDLNTHNRFNWIDGTPIVSMSYYHNQTAKGSREAEFDLSLPIKSANKKQIEANLKNSSATIKNNTIRQLELHFSGILRNIIWDYRELNGKLRFANRKETLLLSLLEKYRDLANLNAIPQYTFHLLQKEVNDSRVLSLQYEHYIQQVLSQYTLVTGLHSLPIDVVEKLPQRMEFNLNNHPSIEFLDATWAAQEYSIKGESNASQPWNLHLTARHMETFDFSENQLGMAVDIPISTGRELSVSQRSAYLQAKMVYEVERDKMLVDIHSLTKSRQAEYQFLIAKQELLEENLPTLLALEKSINQLLDSNTQDHVIHIRNLIDLLEAQEGVHLNRMAIRRQIALVKQAAGLSL